jgi:acyl dehydratase
VPTLVIVSIAGERLEVLQVVPGPRPTTKGETVRVFNDLSEFVAAAGCQLGPTEWTQITQDRVNLFAEATDDHQWIHVDPDRATSGPFGGAIAHGLLTLSLLPHFTHQLYRVDNVALAVNYGYNKVRFITPVKVGANVRARAEISNVDQLDGAVQVTMTVTVEIEGADKPAAVAESIVRFIG